MNHQKQRPTIALCMIVKNERKTLPRLLLSVEGCFDEIHITDTGSNDGTLEYLEQESNSRPGLHVHQFEWIDDFAAARNSSFSHATADFVMWLDADDELGNSDAFKLWRDTAMEFADAWSAAYHYDFKDGQTINSFFRERVVRRSKGLKWEYPVHESIAGLASKNIIHQAIQSWCVNHRHTKADAIKSIARNLSIFKKHEPSESFDGRMTLYFGRDLFSNGNFLEAYKKLNDAARMELDPQDQTLCFLYAANAAARTNQPDQAISIALEGIYVSPLRSEFYNLIGDIFANLNRPHDALPFFAAARECRVEIQADSLPSSSEQVKAYPVLRLAQIWSQLGNLNRARDYSKEAADMGSVAARTLLDRCNEAIDIRDLSLTDPEKLEKTDHIVITCPPGGAYPWDEEIYTRQGFGGSETAAIEMSRHLAQLTGRKVIIFNNTKQVRKFPSGVAYRPTTMAKDYFSKYLPSVCIQWRHTTRLTPAPSFVWCHDLETQGIEKHENYTQAICLSGFSKRYAMTILGIPSEKIFLSRNGLNAERFRKLKVTKNPNKVVFASSPDRGLDRAILIVEKAREKSPDLELHVYYGLEMVEKFGNRELADRLRTMMADRPWVKYHGNLLQDALAKELSSAAVWLYPTNFTETFCITAIECLAAGVFPLVREIGALPDTLREALLNGHARLLKTGTENEEEIGEWAENLSEVVSRKLWEEVEIDLDKYSWKTVAEEWCEWLNLKKHTAQPVLAANAEAG